jgi:hypothetical protein
MDKELLIVELKSELNRKVLDAVAIKMKTKSEEGRKFWNGYCLACNEIYQILFNKLNEQ